MPHKFSKVRFIFTFFLLLIFSYFYLASLPKSVKAVSYTRKVFLQKANTSSFDFRWVTDTQEQLIVKYGLTTSYGSQVTSDAEQLVNCGNNPSFPCTGGSNNHAKITGLAPNTKYYYQVTSVSGTPLTPAGDQNHYFETPPAVSTSVPFTWAIFGDSGNSSSSQNNVAKQLFAKKPDLVIIAGDIAYPYSTDFNNNNTKYFDHYSDATAGQNTMSFSPFYVTCGNHETSCPTVMADHSLPGGGKMSSQLSTYSFDYGNVHFVALNSNASYAYNAANPSASDPQVAWAYNDLRASSQPWKVVFWHHNGWSAGSHSTNTGIVDNFIRMASDAGADIVIWGHSHVYERWNRVSGFYPNVQAYTIGNGGQSGASGCTTTSPGPGCAAKSSSGDSAAGFLFFEVGGDTMTARYITQSGANPDTIALNSGGGTTPIPSPTSGPTSTPTKTPTPKPTNTPTVKPTNTPTPTFKPGTPTPTPSGKIPGDIDGDGDVDIFDYNFLVTNFGLTGNNPADLDNDKDVDIFDYNILVTNFGRTGGAKNPIDEQKACEADPRGSWNTFSSSCADYCWSQVSLRPCLLVLTDSCDCGPDYCWTGQTCEPNPVPFPKLSLSPSPTTKPPTATQTPVPNISVPPSQGQGIWISPQRLASLPTSGSAWNNVKSAADSSAGTPDLANQDDSTNVIIMAKALVYARTGQANYRNDVLSALSYIANSGQYSGRALALGRELAAYVISADLINLKSVDSSLDSKFRAKIRELLTTPTSGGPGSLVECHEDRPNNWGTHCGDSRAAVAAYLGDSAELARVAQVFKGWLGDRTSYSGFAYGDLSWQCDSSKPVGINPKGCTKQGHSIDGVLPDDQRRGGGFTWPPPKENYVWGGLEGAHGQAVILYNAGYDVFNWQDQALLRAIKWLHEQANFSATGDDTWQPHITNFYYGTSFPAPVPANPGKNVGWTDWTHAR